MCFPRGMPEHAFCSTKNYNGEDAACSTLRLPMWYVHVHETGLKACGNHHLTPMHDTIDPIEARTISQEHVAVPHIFRKPGNHRIHTISNQSVG